MGNKYPLSEMVNGLDLLESPASPKKCKRKRHSMPAHGPSDRVLQVGPLDFGHTMDPMMVYTRLANFAQRRNGLMHRRISCPAPSAAMLGEASPSSPEMWLTSTMPVGARASASSNYSTSSRSPSHWRKSCGDTSRCSSGASSPCAHGCIA